MKDLVSGTANEFYWRLAIQILWEQGVMKGADFLSISFSNSMRIFCLAFIVGLFSGCSVIQQPDLERIYRPVAQKPKINPVILIPGIMGSRLTDFVTGENIWPGSLTDLAFGSQLDKLALPIQGESFVENKDNLKPDGLFLSVAGQSFYRDMVTTLEQMGGYHCVSPEKINATSDCVLFAWDWRRDIVEAAAQLDELVEQLRFKRHDAKLKVDIVAHSAGGLVTRYFLRYGKRDVLAAENPIINHLGGEKVRKAILIGTPNYGSVSALQQSIMGSPIGLSSIKPEVLLTMPIQAELLPHPDRNWMIDLWGKRSDQKLFDMNTWRERKWSIFDPDVRTRIKGNFSSKQNAEAYMAELEKHMEKSLNRGAHFHRALSEKAQDGPHKMIVFGGDCHLTPARCLIEKVGAEYQVHLDPSDIKNPIEGIDYDSLMFEPGDGSVTKASLLARDSLDPTEGMQGDFRIDYEFFICEEHTHLAENITFRDNLLNILLNK